MKIFISFFVGALIGFMPNAQAVQKDLYWGSILKTGTEDRGDILKTYFAGPPLSYDPANPKNKVDQPFANWQVEQLFFVPEVVKEITTFGGKGGAKEHGQNGLQRMIQGGKYLYSPIAISDDLWSNEYGLTGFEREAYQVFDLKTFQHRTLLGPDLSTDTKFKLYSKTPYLPYKVLNFSLSPSSRLAARLFWITELGTDRILDAIVVWDPETGAVKKIVLLPNNLLKWDCHTGYCKVLKFPDGEIKSIIPSAPFFVSESEMMLPLVYEVLGANKHLQSFFFQPIRLSSSEQNWLVNLDGKSIALKSQAQSFEIASIKNLYKPIGAECRGINGYSRFFRVHFDNCFVTLPTFSVQTFFLGGASVTHIVGAGTFFTRDQNSTGRYDSLEYYTLDGQTKIEGPRQRISSIPSFYPSAYLPYFNVLGIDYDLYQTVVDSNKFSNWKEGAEVLAAWDHPLLPQGYSFTTLSSVKRYTRPEDGRFQRLEVMEPIKSGNLTNEEYGEAWHTTALTISKFVPKNEFASTGIDRCQAFKDLEIELCNRLFYFVPSPTSIYSGNLLLKNGERIILKRVGEPDRRTIGDCWYRQCEEVVSYKYDALLPETETAKIKITVINRSECISKQNTKICWEPVVYVTGFLEKGEAQYPLEIL